MVDLGKRALAVQQNWKRIVVAIDDPDRRTSWALKKGAELAARSGARLDVFHAYAPSTALLSTFDAKATESIVREAIARRRKRLEHLTSRLRRRGLDVQIDVVWDYPPHEAVTRHVVERKADLLLADSRRHGRLARWFLTNTDWELIRNVPCPVWFVKSPTLRARFRVLAAVDPFHAGDKPARLDDRILQAGAQVAKLLRGRLTLCHVYPPPVVYVPGGPLRDAGAASLSPADIRRYEAGVREAVNRLAQRHGLPRSARFLEIGDPASLLPRLARQTSSDLLVMGAVSRSGLKRLLIGSTAERVIDDATCDILIVKPASFRAAVRRRRVARSR